MHVSSKFYTENKYDWYSVVPRYFVVHIPVDELRTLLSVNPVDMVVVTKTWFSYSIDDCLVLITGYNLLCKDRPSRRGGRVYIRPIRRTDLENDNLECLWLWLHPHCLPRPPQEVHQSSTLL